MNGVNARWLLLAVVASVLAVGIPYWSIPYREANLPDALLGPGLLAVTISALLLRCRRIVSLWKATFVAGGSVALAVLARVLVGVVQDPTSHNLWPLEVVIALLVGFPCALVGACAGSLLQMLVRGHPDERKS